PAPGRLPRGGLYRGARSLVPAFAPPPGGIGPGGRAPPDRALPGRSPGGQWVVHEPLQFDLVEVSGTNQYKVKPLELVSTVAPPIFMVPSADPEDAAGADAAGEPPEPPEPPEPGDELPHAAITSAAATAPAGTSHLFRMTCLRSNDSI